MTNVNGWVVGLEVVVELGRLSFRGLELGRDAGRNGVALLVSPQLRRKNHMDHEEHTGSHCAR